MKWIITRDMDHEPGEPAVVGMMFAPGQSEPGIIVPCTGSNVRATAKELTEQFLLMDDDDNVLFEGKANKMGFGPLEWAEEFAGCTKIQFQIDGEWTDL